MKQIYPMMMLALLLAGSGCMRDDLEDCPPLTVSLEVTDKNYFNVADVEAYGLTERKDENLPFRDYVHSLYYVLCNIETKQKVVEQLNYTVEGDGTTQQITFPADMPYGTYALTVWGNMKSDAPLSENLTAAELEHSDAANNDIYLACDTLVYEYGQSDYTVGLERTKGMLIIQAEGLPENIDYSVKDISNVYSVITSDFAYDAPSTVRTRTDWEQAGGIVTQTLLGPSDKENHSGLDVYFVDKGAYQNRAGGDTDKTLIIPDGVNITMRRNELTVLRYVYREPEMEVYILVNDRWESAHSMVVD